jgi:hypothetical protein
MGLKERPRFFHFQFINESRPDILRVFHVLGYPCPSFAKLAHLGTDLFFCTPGNARTSRFKESPVTNQFPKCLEGINLTLRPPPSL